MNDQERDRFDALLDQVMQSLPPQLHELLEEAPLIVEDRPTSQMLADLGMTAEQADELCGLHTGTALTERSVEHAGEVPDVIHIFRRGIVEHAGGWEPWEDEEGNAWGGPDKIIEEIRITVLHEIGHHFGLNEDDLAELGYE